MPRTHTHTPHFRKNLLAMAAYAALAPQGVFALDLVQEPPLPTSKSSFVAPNVIVSVDDSGSMDYCLNVERTSKCSGKKGADDITTPAADGSWPVTRRRMNVLKYTLAKVFSDKTIIEPNKIRLGWQVLHNNGGSLGAANINSATIRANSIRRLDVVNEITGKSHRDSFLDFVSTLDSNNGTPAHRMFSQADGYMRLPLSKDGPWANNPGGTAAENSEYLGCRRNYHIMMTDGRWNTLESGGNKDGVTQTLGDGSTTYDITSDQTAIYRDTDPDNLADWAFYSWAKKMEPGTFKAGTDKIFATKEYNDAPATETFTSSGTKPKTVTLQKFWNPKYNPATWPHMVTYTIGFSSGATTWPYSPAIVPPSIQAPFGYDNGFLELVTGKLTWTTLSKNDDSQDNDHALDLWHAAINGRGRFYAVTKGEDLETAFKEIIGKINEEAAPLPDKIIGSGSSSGYNVSQSNAGTFVSVYSPKQAWKGWVQASPFRGEEPCPTATEPDKTCVIPDPTSGWNKKTTADLLDERPNVDDRLVLSWSDKWEATKPKGGVPFKWATDDSNLSVAQKALLGVETSVTTAKPKDKGLNVLDYIRGVRDLEGVNPTGYTDDKPFRERKSRQGDIVNSEIWYTGAPISNYSLSGYGTFVNTHKARTPMLYVGGNDGMLHGFSAKDGTEKIAYVPRGVIGGLKKLSDPNYNHQYYVDGSPMTGDVKISSNWATLLVSTLGAGGKGYFVLDVTDPANFASAKATDLVKLDRTRGNSEVVNCTTIADAAEKNNCLDVEAEDKDIGNIVASPVRDSSNLQRSTQIARMNNDRWAVVLGNGYNSANQRPVLLIQYLDGPMELLRIQATTATTGSGNAKDNGLAAPALVDLDGDGRTDVVYAGDNLGNLWKFDLTSDVDTKWKVAFGINTPLFTARGPITKDGTRDQIQPITAPPIARPNDRQMTIGSGASAKDVAVGGMMVAFGTGRNLTADDRNTTVTQNVQTLYSVLDNTRYRKSGSRLEVHPGGGTCPGGSDCVPTPAALGTGVATAKLAKQTIKTQSGSYATVEATQELKTSTWKDYNGWYLDMDTVTGERLLKPMQFYDGSNILAVYTENPSGTKDSGGGATNESCTPTTIGTASGSQYRTLINIMDGKIPTVQIVDMNGDHKYDTNDKNVARAAVNTGSPMLITKGKRILDSTGKDPSKCKDDPSQCAEELNRMPEQSLRPSWRQVK